MSTLFDKLTDRFRVFRLVAAALLCGWCSALVGQASQPQARFSVTPEQVLQAMQERDWSVNGVQVRLAAPVTATAAHAELQIESVSPVAGHEALLRMVCRVHTECIPFFASVIWPTNVSVPSLAAKPLGTANALAPSVIRAGSPATLLLEGARIHIRLRVVFAENGHVGDRLRVTTPNHKQTYVAEVLTPQLLRGEF